MSFINQLLNGLSLGSIYALVALGYTMVYGIAQLINFAHGEIIMIGSYTAIYAISGLLLAAGLPFYLAILPSVLVCMVVGVLIERLAYKPLRNSPRITNLITAIGVSLLLQNSFMKIFGAGAKSVPPIFKSGVINIGEINISPSTYVTIIITALLTIILQLL